MDTCVIRASQSGSCACSHSISTLLVRPLTCANRPPLPVRSTRPVSNRSTQVFSPVAGSTS